ncbi:MAG: hypothetical protein IJT38_01680 [Clostridia bacterium]|nr:hypothetical protein [Clostridia bacterium]
MTAPEHPFGVHDLESFTVGGVEFEYSGTENFGYCKLKNNGGIITGDGMKIVIVYYGGADGENVICRIYG